MVSEASFLLASIPREVVILASNMLIAKFEGSRIFFLQFIFLDLFL